MTKKKRVDKIYIDFDGLYDKVKKLSELRSRSMTDGMTHRFVITDSEKDLLEQFYRTAVSEVAERLGVVDRLRDYGGTAIYKLTERQTDQHMKRTRQLLFRVLVNYILFEWYRSAGASDVAEEYLQFYQEYVEQYRTNSTQESFFKPTYTPYW